MAVSTKLSLLLCFCLSCCMFTTTPAQAQEDTFNQPETSSKTSSENSSNQNKKSSKVLDDDSLFGGINFVKGMKKSGNEGTQDEIEGEVEVTTNPYTSIPEPTGLIAGVVYDPTKDGKQASSSSSADMITGLANILNAMQSSKK